MNSNSARAIEVFKDGGIVIFPTDTAFGIGCRVDVESSVKKVFEIRKRPESKPVLVLVSSLRMAEQYAFFNKKTRDFVNKYWPAGVTIILPAKVDRVLPSVRADGKTVAVRMPKHKEMLEVINGVGVPILAPSANFSGGKTPYFLNEVEEKLRQNVDYVLLGECYYKKESTIIDTTVNPWKVLRKGAVEVSVV